MGKSMFELQQDLIIEIVMRLPIKSLLRFKCVSKQWSSLISSRDLCKSLYTVTRQQQQQPRLYMSLVDCKDGKRVLLSMSSTSPDNTRFVVDQDLSIFGMGGSFLNVFRCLMCFSVREKTCIYNPTTKQLLTLPAIKSDIRVEQGHWKSTQYYIGHDPVSDQYKIFCTISTYSKAFTNPKSEHWVFTVEGGGSLKKVVPLQNDNAPLGIGRAINGSVIHYMAFLDSNTYAVVSFNVRSEELTIFHVPRAVGNVDVSLYMMKAGLIDYGGKIAIFDNWYLFGEDRADLWVLEEIAGKKEWSKQTLVLQPCQRHLVQQYKNLIVQGKTKDGKVILTPLNMCSEFYILYYDMQRNDLRKVEIKGVPHCWFGKECYFDLNIMDESESFIY